MCTKSNGNLQSLHCCSPKYLSLPCRSFAMRPSSDRTAAARGPALSPPAARRPPSKSGGARSAISAHTVQSPELAREHVSCMTLFSAYT